MTRTGTTRERCAAALIADGREAISGKGGFWIQGFGFLTLREVARLYRITAATRVHHPKISAYGDYATIAMLNGIRP